MIFMITEMIIEMIIEMIMKKTMRMVENCCLVCGKRYMNRLNKLKNI